MIKQPPSMRNNPEKWLNFAAWWIIPPLFGAFAILLGQDANWDLRNYHFYNPYSFIYDRMNFDILPSQVANFYNPLFYVPYYHLVTMLPPKGVGFVLGWIQGFNFPLLLAIVRRMLLPAVGDGEPRWKRSTVCFGIALIGMLGAANVSELGTMFSDNLLSLLILSSLWIMLASIHHLLQSGWKIRLGIVIGAGFLAGMAIGFKQPCAIYAIGLCAACFAFTSPFMHRFFLSFFYGIGVLFGIAVTGGYWLYEMWVRFKNPLFPYFNLIFRSPMATIGDYRDTSYLPDTLGEALISPFFFGFAPYQFSEVAYRDLRIPLLYVLLLTLLVTKIIEWVSDPTDGTSTETSPIEKSSVRYLLTFGVVSYLTWLKTFAIFRYALVLELLAPLGIVMILGKLIPNRIVRQAVAGMALVILLITLKPADWGRVSWGEDYFGADIPNIEQPGKTLILMTGAAPMSYLVPLFPKEIRFIRIQSYFTGPSSHPNGYDRMMADVISRHTGPMHILFRIYEKTGATSALEAYGLDLESDSCRILKPRIESNEDYPLNFCAVTKKATS